MVTTTSRRVTAITSRNGYESAVEFINAVPPIEQVLKPVKSAEVRRLGLYSYDPRMVQAQFHKMALLDGPMSRILSRLMSETHERIC